ncbi:BMP family ABC transporter substrate-binding protein [Bacillus sp. FJAT-26390]|uniref:BMP family ABC transporter substrate-binding protein n=1 Tax=Bacillus sp. FJAT-26390 TaxID=1743142 RepID=UPI000807B2A2|nr:BMP family ABC transporter substrate-binding protein [Bacillus sp. FJAT-26390]OBZ17451.1 hypothetical protein A7975_06170 [Bacillus sp. FJAT-26390]
MMKSFRLLILFPLMMTILLNGCGAKEEHASPKRLKVGIMLSNDGLGDQSFSDGAFAGLTKARDELGIELDYRELPDLESFDQGLTELVDEKCDLIVGLGFAVKESLENVSEQFPEQQFILIDDTSELPNVASLTFKEDEGSFLVGVLPAEQMRKGSVIGQSSHPGAAAQGTR